MVKNKWLILLAVLLLLAAVPTAWAAEIGSIQVRGIEGTVALYPVASPDGTLKDDFANVSSDILDRTNAASKAKALWAYALAEKLPGQSCQADAEGNALFSLLEQGLYLIGIRDVTDGREYHYFEVREFAERYGTLTTIMSETALDDAMEFLKNVDGKEKEGFVLNIDGFRVKLKSDDYVNIHNSIWEIQNDNVLFLAVKNDVIDDTIAKLPKSMVDEVVRKRDLIVEFARNRERTAREYLERMSELGLSEKRDAMIWITENVPSDYESLVRSLYLGKEADYLKGFKAADILGEQ
jgi:hypothetical protein